MTIHAVSESMMYSFGIPATLANGVTANRYEFNIGSIFPEINLKKVENVSNGIGYPCTIDTSSLKDDFWFEQQKIMEEVEVDGSLNELEDKGLRLK